MHLTATFNMEENCNVIATEDGIVLVKSYNPMLTTFLESEEFSEAFTAFVTQLNAELDEIEFEETDKYADDTYDSRFDEDEEND